MAAIGGAATEVPAAAPPDRAPESFFRRATRFARTNEGHLWRWGGLTAAILPFAALIFTVIVLADKGFPAVKVNGWQFLTASEWKVGNTYGATVHTGGVAHPLGSSYGAWPLIVGTLQSSVIALVIALPISIGAAFALTERIPRWMAEILRFTIELLAGVPSVLLGLWGALTLGPWLARDIYPPIANNMPNVPVLSYWRGATGHGEGLLTSGIILALMIVPIIASTARNLFAGVPALPREGGEALGMTDWEVARKVTIPWVRGGLIGATVLGLGRALGETIAVAMISGALLSTIAPNIYGTMGTVAATVVTQLDGALADGTGFALRTLAELALVLAIITVLVNVIARVIINRTGRLAAPVGAG